MIDNENPIEEEVLDDKETTTEETAPEVDEIELLKNEIEDLKNEALYKRAEFDNFRKRTIKEKEEIRNIANKNLMLDLIEVIDDFDRANTSGEEIPEGITIIIEKLYKKLVDNGLEKIETQKGSTFDSDISEAICTTHLEGYEGKVVDTATVGYKLNGTIIRFAKVVVGE